MELKLFNTLTRKKEIFKPIKKDYVGMYSCGPTVYWYPHIGNMRTYVFSDILKRVLEYNGFNVKHVMNVTDVGHLVNDGDIGEDKIEKGAKNALYLKCKNCKKEFFSGIILPKNVFENSKIENNKHECPICKTINSPNKIEYYYKEDNKKTKAEDIANYYWKVFRDDFKKLNIIEPSIWTKATEHIKEQIELIKKLEEKGYTYRTEDGIYFDTSKFKDYGKMAKLNTEELIAGKRTEMRDKKNKTDFALWKFSENPGVRQQEWESPWGIGFPGWHIECSAMSMKYLGESFDIHTGGEDHIQVHHTNEIAQSEAATEKKFVNYWLHGAYLTFHGEKISKSKGGLYTISELEKQNFHPLSFRYMCLTTHYRKPLNFSLGILESAQNSFNRLKNIISEIKYKDEKKNKKNIDAAKKQFLEIINDNLNLPKATAFLWEILRDEKLNDSEKYELTIDFDKVLGLGLDKEENIEIPDDVLKIVEEREVARKNKDWKKSDELREKILKKGYKIDDTKNGTKIKLAN
jgi:cysteinyl-tRNA synthetase